MHYTITEFFEETVEKYPDREAVSDLEQILTFRELRKYSRYMATGRPVM